MKGWRQGFHLACETILCINYYYIIKLSSNQITSQIQIIIKSSCLNSTREIRIQAQIFKRQISSELN